MPDPDNGPISSYSDPFYDRLDALAQKVRRHRLLVILGVLVAIIIALLVARWLAYSPEAAGANALIAADKERDPLARENALAKIGTTAPSPAFRALAMNEVVQARLDRDDIEGARSAAKAGLDEARKSADDNLQVTLQLSVAAVEFQAKAWEAAATAYQAAEKAAGARFPNHRITAQVGYARCLAAQPEKPDNIQAAIDKLELLTTSSEMGATNLINDARVLYWRLKRQQVGADAAMSASVAALAPAPAAPASAAASASAAAPATAALPAAPESAASH